MKTKLAEAQLENLRLQLQPHFLFNTLNTISSVMYEDVKAADVMLTQLSDLLRLTLRASRTHEIPLADELQITQLYLDLMQKRYEEKLRVRYEIDAALNDSMVPQLILQPLLENSLRHGMKASGEAIDISIAAHRENGSLLLKISDTGVGLGLRSRTLFWARGRLSNIRDRSAQLYGEGRVFRIANRPSGGAEVTLHLPYRTYRTLAAASSRLMMATADFFAFSSWTMRLLRGASCYDCCVTNQCLKLWVKRTTRNRQSLRSRSSGRILCL